MSSDVLTASLGVRHPRAAVVPNGVLAMLVAVAMETMLFAGLVSAFLIGRANAGALAWPPLDQPRLPVPMTTMNTVILLASGVALAFGQRAFDMASRRRGARRFIGVALALGVTFVSVQGYEWARLVRFGLTLRSSSYGSFFYLLVGAHAIHAVIAILALAWVTGRLREGPAVREALATVGIFWYFVVLIWPLLYVLVYLS